MTYITVPMRAEDRIKSVLSKLADTTELVHIVSDFFVFELVHWHRTNISGIPGVSVFENPFYGIDGLVKRVVDVRLSALLITVLTIPVAVTAIL